MTTTVTPEQLAASTRAINALKDALIHAGANPLHGHADRRRGPNNNPNEKNFALLKIFNAPASGTAASASITGNALNGRAVPPSKSSLAPS